MMEQYHESYRRPEKTIEEARREIEKVRKSKAKALSLAGWNLGEIPESVAQLIPTLTMSDRRSPSGVGQWT
jgi:hypothetical protein